MKKEIIVTAKQFRTESDFPLVAEDTNAYEVVFYAEEDITDGYIAVTALRADGLKQTCSAKPSGNIARCLLTKNMYCVPGELVLRVTVTDGKGTEITTNEILFNVLSPSMENISEDTDTVNTLLSLLSQVGNTLQDAKFITTIAANAADLAETKGFYANEMGQNAEKAAKAAQDAAEKAETEAAVAEIMTDFISKKAGQLPPAFSESDEGKILYLSRNESASELRNFSDTFDSSNFEGTFLDAGMADSSTCYIDISAPALYSNGILNPLDEGCMFGFTFIPDYSEYDSDYDVIIESVEETEGGFRMFFGAESCLPFTENVTDDDSLFTTFEQIRFNAEFPEAKVTGKWGTPEEVLPSSFIDSNIISPALQLSKEYTDMAVKGAKAYADEQSKESIIKSTIRMEKYTDYTGFGTAGTYEGQHMRLVVEDTFFKTKLNVSSPADLKLSDYTLLIKRKDTGQYFTARILGYENRSDGNYTLRYEQNEYGISSGMEGAEYFNLVDEIYFCLMSEDAEKALKKYLDSRVEETLKNANSHTDSALDKAIYSTGKVLSTVGYPDRTVEVTVPDDAISIKTITVEHQYDVPPMSDAIIYFYSESGSLIYSDYIRLNGPLNFVMDVNDNADNPIKRISISNVDSVFAITAMEYYKMGKVEKYKDYTDTAIENAIVKSWEEAV